MSKAAGNRLRVCALLIVAWLDSGEALPSIAARPDTPTSASTALPEFTHQAASDWINSVPLSLHDLHGHVVLLHVWAFECWNCYRSFPWLETIAERYAPQGLQIVGVHSPEFEREKVRDSVVEKAVAFGLDHPIMLDNDLSYWRALDNRYWPAWYLIDRSGAIRTVAVGETHAGDLRAQALEHAIELLLAEPPVAAP